MAPITKAQLLADVELLFSNADQWTGYYSGHLVDDDDPDSEDESDARTRRYANARKRLVEFIENRPENVEASKANGRPKGKPRGRAVAMHRAKEAEIAAAIKEEQEPSL